MVVNHSINPLDRVTMAEMRSMVASTKGSVTGPSAREPFDELMERMVVPTGRRWRRSGNSVPPWRRVCRRFGASVSTFRRRGCSAGESGRLRARVRISPRASVSGGGRRNAGLVEKGFAKIALAGDSAGGGLALVLLSSLVSKALDGSGLRVPRQNDIRRRCL
jgi:epsilon-lactone hydrolase